MVVVPHDGLLARLPTVRALFDDEYLTTHGPWDPDQPYGYAPADHHVVATHDGELVGHVGLQRRVIGVGERDVVVAGVGGVLVAPRSRSTGVGRRLLHAAGEAIVDPLRADFGYLGCREEVVPFYVSCGWHRIQVREIAVDRLSGRTVAQEPGPPLLVHPGVCRMEQWPDGDVDLRGRPW